MLKTLLLIIFLYLIIDALIPIIKKYFQNNRQNTTIHKNENMSDSKDTIDDEDIIDADYKELNDK